MGYPILEGVPILETRLKLSLLIRVSCPSIPCRFFVDDR